MSKKGAGAIQNAREVIKRFGGLRPMGSKTDVPVSTIQGWKKRNRIPAARRDEILKAARTHEIELGDLIGPQTAGEDNNTHGHDRQGTSENPKPSVPMRIIPGSTLPAVSVNMTEEDFARKLAEVEKKAVRKSTLIAVSLTILIIGALSAGLAYWLKPWSLEQADTAPLKEDMVNLRGEVEDMKAEQSFLSTLIPEDLNERIARLQEQARETRETVDTALEKAKAVSDDVISRDAGSLEERMDKLGTHMEDFAKGPHVAPLMARIEKLRGTEIGRTQLNRAMSELGALATTFGGTDQFESALQAARAQSTALNQTFEGVPSDDIKAAALLLGMTQFRESLNRDQVAFEEDLKLLENLVNTDNPELNQALARLAPHAKSGVLTPSGLSNELKTIAGETVAASLKGEDVSFTERARARMNEVFKVEKNGELLTGTPTQAKLDQAEKMLENGDVAAAVAEVETLEGPALETAQPWLEKARATLAGQNAKSLIDRSIAQITQGQGELIQDKRTGINILKTTP